MVFKDIELKQFRSHHAEKFIFKPGVNTIIGPNGGGKTNLLEALYLISTGTTFRSRDRALIEHGKKQALIKTNNEDQTRVLKLTFNQDKSPIKEFKINNQKILRLQTHHKIPICLFEPNHLQVIYNGPDLRRNLVDQLLSQIFPVYHKALNNYKRALIQRNNLLKKDRQVLDDELFIWNVHLSEYGNTLVEYRREWTQYFNQKASQIYSNLSDIKSEVQIIYKSKYNDNNYGSWLLSKLQSTNKNDKIIGFTTHGPHRDDITFILNRQIADQTASRGEIRSLMLTYKIIEMDYMKDILDQKPIVMLDDVFSELDDTRQFKLTKLFEGHQVFITTTHKIPTITKSNIIKSS